MATFPNLFQCKNPWTFKKGWLQSGGEAPAGSSEPVVEVTELTHEEIEEQKIKERKELASEISNQFLKPQEDGSFKIDFGIGAANQRAEELIAAKAAQNVTRLDMMLPNEVTKVKLDSKYYKRIVPLVKCQDGKFREEGKSTTDKHFYVFQNDEVTVLERNGASTVEIDQQDAAPAAPAAAPATPATVDTPTAAPAERTETLAESRIKEGKGLADNYSSTFKFPPEFKGKTGEELNRMLATSRYAGQLKSALEAFSEIKGDGNSTVGLLEDMRTRNLFGSKNSLSINEITQSIFGKESTDLRMDYDRLLKKNPDSKERHNIDAFYWALADLKDALDKLDYVETKESNNTTNQTDAEKALSYLFDPKDDGPIIKARVGQWLRGQRAHTLSLDYHEGRDTNIQSAMEAYTDNYAEAAAWERIRTECSNEQGELDENKLVTELNRLLVLGKEQAILLNHNLKNGKSLIDTPARLQTIIASSIEGPQYKELIQLGFSRDLIIKEEQKTAIELDNDLPEDIRAEMNTKTSVYLGAIVEGKNLRNIGAGVSHVIGQTEKGENIYLHMGIQNNVLTRQVSVGMGVSAVVLRSEKITITTSGGFSLDTGGALGFALPINVPLGKEKIYSVQITPIVGYGGLGLALGLALGIGRDLQAVLEEKVNTEKETLNKIEDLPEESKKQIQAIAEARGLDAMKNTQFVSAGVGIAYFPEAGLIVPYPYFNIALGGKTYRVFEQTGDYNAELTKAITENGMKEAEGHMITLSESGPIIQDASGALQVGEARLESNNQTKADERLNQINEALKTKNIQLVKEIDGRVVLDVRNARGNVNIYADPSGGIELYPEDGKIYVNMTMSESFGLYRLDEWSNYGKNNAYQNTKIIIGSNTLKPLDVLKSADRHLQMGNGLTATMIQDRVEGEVSQGVIKDKMNEGHASFHENDPARLTVATDIGKLVRIQSTPALTPDRLAAIDAAVQTLMANETSRKQYKDVSTSGTRERLISLITQHNEKNDDPWNGQNIDPNNPLELNVFLQKIMEDSLVDLNRDNPEALKRSLEWNKKKMEKILESRGLDPATAKSMAEGYIEAAKRTLKTGSAIAIPEGAYTSIAVGTEGFEGTRSSFWKKGGQLLNPIEVRTEQTLKDLLPPLSNKENAFDSAIGVALLSQAKDLPFTTEELTTIKDMLKSPDKNDATYQKFAAMVDTLSKGETYNGENGTIITPDIFWQIGLYDKCLNFCEVYSAKVTIQKPGARTSTGAATMDSTLDSTPTKKYIGLGGAVAVTPGGDSTGSGEKDRAGGMSSDQDDGYQNAPGDGHHDDSPPTLD